MWRSGTMPLLLFTILLVSRPLYGEGQPAPQPRPSTAKQVPGYQGLFIAGFNLPSSADSFAASGLKDRPFEIGGGVQATNVWRGIFVQASATRWQETGERTFIDSNGTQYPLGISHQPDGGGRAHRDHNRASLRRGFRRFVQRRYRRR